MNIVISSMYPPSLQSQLLGTGGQIPLRARSRALDQRSGTVVTAARRRPVDGCALIPPRSAPLRFRLPLAPGRRPWWRPARRCVPSEVGRRRPPRSASMPWGALGRAPTPVRWSAMPSRSPPAVFATPAAAPNTASTPGSARFSPVAARFGVLSGLPTRLDQLRMPRSTGAQPPTRPAPPRSAAPGLPSAAHRPPIRRDRPSTQPGAAQVAARSAPKRLVSAAPSPVRDPRRVHPAPRSVPGAPATARTLSRAYDRRVSDFGFWIGFFEIEKWAEGSPVREPGSQGDGAVQGPPAAGKSWFDGAAQGSLWRIRCSIDWPPVRASTCSSQIGD